MNAAELYKLIEEGEGSEIEFKRKFSSSKKIAKEMIAFANTKGGSILFGVDDNRKITGIKSEKSELELIDTAARFFCDPEIHYRTEIVPVKNTDVIVIKIPESKTKPHKLIDEDDKETTRVYIRFNDKSVIASKETINILKHSYNNNTPLVITLGENEKALLTFLEENGQITVKEFKKLVNISERRASRLLVNLVRAKVIRHHRENNREFFTLI